MDALKELVSFDQESFIGPRIYRKLQPALIRLLQELPIEQPLKDTLISQARQAAAYVEKGPTQGRFQSYRISY